MGKTQKFSLLVTFHWCPETIIKLNEIYLALYCGVIRYRLKGKQGRRRASVLIMG